MPSLEELFGIGTEHVDDFPPPFASAVVYKNDSLNKVIAKKWNSNLGCWQRIAQGKAGVDDAKVIQSAINYVAAGVGGEVKIKSGEYLIKEIIQIGGANYINIKGEGNVKLKASTNITNIFRQSGKTIKNFAMKNIELDGNDLADIVCYFEGGLENILFDNVNIHNSAKTFTVFFDTELGINKKIALTNSKFGYSSSGYDIVGCGAEEISVLNCTFENNENRRGEGIAIAGAKKAVIAFNRFLSPSKGFADNAIHTESTCNDVIVVGNYIYQYAGHAIHIVNNVQRVIIEGNIVDATPAYLYGIAGAGDIYLSGVQNAVVRGNIIQNSSWNGIVGFDVENIIIENNVLIDASWANTNVVLGDGTEHQRSAIAILNTAQANTAKRNIHIRSNLVRNINRIYTNGILVDNQYSDVYIYDNDIKDAFGEKLYCIALNADIRRNAGYTTENSGTASITGDGVTTTFTIPHGLVSTPSYVNVLPKAGAPTPSSIDVDATNITLTFSTAPATGTYYYWWEARV